MLEFIIYNDKNGLYKYNGPWLLTGWSYVLFESCKTELKISISRFVLYENPYK